MGKTKKHKTFFQDDSPHGIVKRVMYKKYLQAYIAKTQNEKFNLKTIIIDGFAGAGRYSDDWPEEIEKYGSPLIALMVTLNFLLKKAERLANKTSSDSKITNEEDTEESSSVIEPTAESSTSETCLAESRTEEQKTRKFTSWISAVNLTDEELIEEAKSCRENGFDYNTDTTMIFIEDDKKNYINLVNNIELMLVKFLKSRLPTCRYKYRKINNEGIHSTTFSMNIAPYSFAIQVHNRKFETFDPPRELEARCTRSLTFLDPFGFSHTPMAHVKKFAPGEGNEIFINFMSQYVNRNIKNTPKYICDLYGIDVADETDLDTMIECIKNSLNPETEGGPFKDKITRCTDMYRSYLKGQTTTSFSQAFEVKGQGNVIIYHLIHTTNHIRGIEAMKEAMNRCSQKPGEMSMSDYDIIRKGHILNFGNLDDPDVVADLIFEKFKGKPNILLEPSAQESNRKLKSSRYGHDGGREVYNRSPTVKEFVLLDTKFLYRKKAIKTLQRQGKITYVDENEKPQKRKFPDKDSKTEISKKRYVSFPAEAPESDCSQTDRQKMSKQNGNGNYNSIFTQVTKPIAETTTNMSVGTEIEPVIEEEKNATPVAETEPMAPADTNVTRLHVIEPMAAAETIATRDDTEQMAAAETSETRDDETEPMALAETSGTLTLKWKKITDYFPTQKKKEAVLTMYNNRDESSQELQKKETNKRKKENKDERPRKKKRCETEPMAAAETSATRVDETEPMAEAETSATIVDDTELMAAAETSATRADETEPMAAAETSGTLTLKREKITDYFPTTEAVLTMYNRDDSSKELLKRKTNKRKKENKDERPRKKKRCETRGFSDGHDEND